jgi:hypothetical protein
MKLMVLLKFCNDKDSVVATSVAKGLVLMFIFLATKVATTAATKILKEPNLL